MLNNKRTKQVISLYLSMILSVFIGIGVSVFNTRLLGPQYFGDYKFLQMLFNFTVTFFTLGLFVTGSKMLAQKENELIRKELIGALINLAIIMSTVFIFFFFVFSFFQGRIFDKDLGWYIRIFCPLLFVFPFQLCITNILQGDNRIYELSLFRILPSILYLIFSAIVNYFFNFSLFYALCMQFITFIISILLIIIFIKPSFKKQKVNLLRVVKENKTYGFPVYIGTLCNVASAQLGVLSVGYFIDNVNVGFFSLAITITNPLMMIPGVVGTVFFKDFANSDRISNKVVFVTIILSIIALLGFLGIVEHVILQTGYLVRMERAYIYVMGQ